MSMKVKRGLGLLVVALIGYFAVHAAQSGDATNTAVASVEFIGWLVVAVGLIGGLGLLAWGLLRD